MKKEDLKNSNFIVNKSCSIKEAMKAVTDNHRGTVIVVDDDFLFYGIVSDGDFRRALLKGATEMTPVSKIVNANPLVIQEGGQVESQAEEIFQKYVSINLLPVVDKNNKLVLIKIRNNSSALPGNLK